jgi:hypothetical protein
MTARAAGRGGLAWIIAIVTAMVGALACVAALEGAARPPGPPESAVMLTSGSEFGLSGTVSNLAPGLPSSLVLTATNPHRAAIIVIAVTASITAVPAGCPAANLRLGNSAFTGSPPAVRLGGLHRVVPPGGSASVAVPILLVRRAGNGCQHITFPLAYVGTAVYATGARATWTALSVSLRWSRSGRAVTFTATVGVRPLMTARPSGTVTFYLCTRPPRLPLGSAATACRASTALGPAMAVSIAGQAQLTTSSLPPGTHSIFAGFSASGSYFQPSASRTLTERVILSRACGAAARCRPAKSSGRTPRKRAGAWF